MRDPLVILFGVWVKLMVSVDVGCNEVSWCMDEAGCLWEKTG